jgi:16S rRNA C1402 (ribose-2'-O) methylase RsmI
MPDEQFHRGTATDLYKRLGDSGLKGEFVIVIEGRTVQPGDREA